MTIQIPAFKPHLRAIPVPGEGVLLISEGGGHVLFGPKRAHIAALIDGERSAEEIVRGTADTIEPTIAWSILMKLEADGWIEESRPPGDRKAAAFWFALGLDPDAAGSAFAAVDVRVRAVSEEMAEMANRFAAALRGFGIAPSAVGPARASDPASPDRPDAAAAGLDIVLVEDYLADDLRALDNIARASGRRWMLVRLSGAAFWLGPMFGDAGAPCLDCLRRRLGDLRPDKRMAARHGHQAADPLGALAVTEEAACIAAALEVAKFLSGAGTDLSGNLRTIDLRDWSSRLHRVIAHPACAVCGAGVQDEPRPVTLKSSPVAFDADGGFRTVSPEQTLRSFEHLVSPLVGIVGGLSDDIDMSGLGHNYAAADARWQMPTRLSGLVGGFRHASAGKGIGSVQARAGAVCESVERYSGRMQGTEPRRPAAWRELAGRAIHPNAVMNFSALQFRNRDEWNRRRDAGYNFVPRPLDPDEPIDWTPVWSLTEERHKLLPTELLYYGGTGSAAPPVAVGCSNGCASGNTLEEAVLQGFLELVERDAVAVWWYNRLRRPGIDFDSFDHPWIAAQPERYRAIGREIVLLDLTTDLKIPVVGAVSWQTGTGAEESDRITLGFGCHVDVRIAAQRALTEGIQMLTFALAGAGPERHPAEGWLNHAVRADHPQVLPNEGAPVRERRSFPHWDGDDLLECIAHCREQVESRGMEVLVLDQTRADTRMPVVKVLVPGLRHFWSRLGPGRLYDVPVSMGWLDRPLAESELNPVAFFL